MAYSGDMQTPAVSEPAIEQLGLGDLVGEIRHRLLINRWVDPDEVSPLLPDGVRPRIGSNGGVVAGCCLIALDGIRPWPASAFVGRSVHAAAHRISIEAGPESEPTSGVYVPMRHTDSRVTVLVGGRIVPGVHQRSTISSSCDTESVAWKVQPAGGSGDDAFAIHAVASRRDSTEARSEVADIVIGSYLGLSPNRRDCLEGADMQPFNLRAETVSLTELSSAFLEQFSSAEEADTLLMTNVGVTWRRVPVEVDA